MIDTGSAARVDIVTRLAVTNRQTAFTLQSQHSRVKTLRMTGPSSVRKTAAS